MTVMTAIARWGRIAATASLVAALAAGLAACGVRSSPVGPEGSTFPFKYPSSGTDDTIIPASALTRPPEHKPETLIPKPPEPKMDGPAFGEQTPAPAPAASDAPSGAPIGAPVGEVRAAPAPGSTGQPPLILFRPLPEWPPGGPANPEAPPATELIVR